MYKKELSHLKKDPIMALVVEKYGDIVWAQAPDLFEDLVESIISQQLSGKAAKTIFGRFKDLYPSTALGTIAFPTPKQILATPHEKLRAVGLSNAKARYVKSLAEFVDTGQLVLDELKDKSDEEVITSLTRVKGIGRWTAEMILIFSLGRPDVFSMGDLGLKKAISKLYKVDMKDLEKIEKISDAWSPYRSLACRYLWKSLE